jgi:hypothetical protein
MMLAMDTRTASPLVIQRHAHAIRGRALARHTTIEWEELPSLADALRAGDRQVRPAPAWNPTLPLGLWQPQPEVAPAPFSEPLRGLHVREILGDEVFQHFFGR